VSLFRISVRRAGLDDLEAILRVEEGSFGDNAWPREQFLDYFRHAERSMFLVASLNDRIVGYLLTFVRGDYADVDSLAVLPRYRRKGIGKALMQRSIALLRRRGFETVYLNVREDNETAIQLYESLGFRKARRINEYFEDGAAALRMRLQV
jgi:ribosomal-protein-alanine N-acetyltransferase